MYTHINMCVCLVCFTFLTAYQLLKVYLIPKFDSFIDI